MFPFMSYKLTDVERLSALMFTSSKIFQKPPKKPFHSLQTVCLSSGIALPPSSGFDSSNNSCPSLTPSLSVSDLNGLLPIRSSSSSFKPSPSLSLVGGAKPGPPVELEDELELELELEDELELELELLLEDELELEDELLDELELEELELPGDPANT